ncbi:class I lanthipeptide [uncultured Aquimarina sp.]|uniref:class I lanthipeptide n=1 Tax=uncultured Aquimarina sp. TaxID=575652 RepID=UPI0026346B84|nr:class I lanthipeptide [uncultured Aquimarina sp.]
MENKKGKKLSLQKIKIAKLNQNGLQHIKGGTGENPIDFSATQCDTDTCPDPTFTCITELVHSCGPITICVYASNNNCRSDGRVCVDNL